jgi:hypothetical protein
MATLIYAHHIRCDVPRCETAVNGPPIPDGEINAPPPDGWLCLAPTLCLTLWGRPVIDLCPFHANSPVRVIYELFKEEASVDANTR